MHFLTFAVFRERTPMFPSPRRLSLLLLAFGLAGGSFAATTAREPDFGDFDRRARAGARLSVVFFGASLTWGANASDPQQTSYRARVAQRLAAAYPAAHFAFHDAAIGGTTSQLGVFRLDRDVLRHAPDLVFLDFSANDGINEAAPETLASYEAIVRRLVSEARTPVVQVILPFKWDIDRGTTDGMAGRDAHLAIAKAYHTAVGDAVALAQSRVKAGAVTTEKLWPFDGMHPGDRGYDLFADAAWTAFNDAVRDQRVCSAPEKMLHAFTYLRSARVRLSTLGPPPSGWHVSAPNPVSAYFDMLMSRWLDDELVATPSASTGGAAPFRARFTGSMVMLFGESTVTSAPYRVLIDGEPVKQDFRGSTLAEVVKGNAHHVQVIADGLDPTREHTLEIRPLFSAGTAPPPELRLESICVAGGDASVRPAAP